jgi:DNA-binding response OmpR family regulator
MTLGSQRRALIVEDEYLFAMSLAVDMQALGFDTCDVAANAQDAFLQAMENLPDIVLMDVNLEGGREGIEAARWLREVGDVPSSSSLHTPTAIPSSAFMNRCQTPR